MLASKQAVSMCVVPSVLPMPPRLAWAWRLTGPSSHKVWDLENKDTIMWGYHSSPVETTLSFVSSQQTSKGVAISLCSQEASLGNITHSALQVLESSSADKWVKEGIFRLLSHSPLVLCLP